jgi:predicted DNA-binding transcriptional regulator AlpA
MNSMSTKNLKVEVPDTDPLTAGDVATALKVSVSDVYRMISEGRFGAMNIARDHAERAAFRIPLKNFVQYINGIHSAELFFRFPAADPLKPARIAKALNCTAEHIYHLIADGEFPNAINNARKKASRPDWQIPLCDLVAYVNRRREGVFE